MARRSDLDLAFAFAFAFADHHPYPVGDDNAAKQEFSGSERTMSPGHGAVRGDDVRARLDYPVIDGDGHVLECTPVFLDYFKDVAGADLAGSFYTATAEGEVSGWYALTPDERRRQRSTRPAFWFSPMRNTADRATAMLPGLLRRRMEEIGLDCIVVYTTLGLLLVGHPDEEMRRASCRAPAAARSI